MNESNESIKKILKRLAEPSSKAGLALLCAVFGASAGLPEVLQSVAVAVLSVWAIITPEQK